MATSFLVGRTSDLHQLNHWLTQTLVGKPRLVFVTGEAGVGKTHLVEEFIKQAKFAEPKLVVAIGYCSSHFGQADPLHPFREISTQLFSEDDDNSRSTSARELGKKAKDVLWELAPDAIGIFLPFVGIGLKLFQVSSKSAREKTMKQAESESQLRTMFFEQFSRLLFWASEQAPLLLVLEDLHWADESTIELLFYLARAWKSQPLMIVATYRADEIAATLPEHPLLRVERELTRYDLCHQLTVGWLNESNVQDWLTTIYPANRFPKDFVRWLHERTEGNALFVSEILKDLEERRLLFQDANQIWLLSSQLKGVSDLPDTITAVLDQRLARLEKQLLDMLTCASVEGFHPLSV